jgi:hypothetical protein
MLNSNYCLIKISIDKIYEQMWRLSKASLLYTVQNEYNGNSLPRLILKTAKHTQEQLLSNNTVKVKDNA